MELTNEFRVAAPPEQAWPVLTDVELIAPCMPGAELQEIDGDDYRGVVKVKVGPITAQYKGVARFVERDGAAHRAVLRAEGRDTRGQGNANATITVQLTADGDGTRVSVVTDLQVTGRVAQFGRGILGDVSAKLMAQFADCLAGKLRGDDAPVGDDPAEAEASADSGPIQTEVPPVDLLGTAGGPVLARLAPILGFLGGILLLRRFRRRRRERRRQRRARG